MFCYGMGTELTRIAVADTDIRDIVESGVETNPPATYNHYAV